MHQTLTRPLPDLPHHPLPGVRLRPCRFLSLLVLSPALLLLDAGCHDLTRNIPGGDRGPADASRESSTLMDLAADASRDGPREAGPLQDLLQAMDTRPSPDRRPDYLLVPDSGCPAGLTSCKGACVDLQKDPKFCGSCAVACSPPGNPCSQAACTAGKCGSKPLADWTACSSGSPGTCHGGSCCTGCWSGAACETGSATSACGQGGKTCQVCAFPAGGCSEPACQSGVCSTKAAPEGTPCTSGTDNGACAQGTCCTGCRDNGGCQPGSAVTSCGLGGAACTACLAGQTCQKGTCLCDAVSCPKGCCDSSGACLDSAAQNDKQCGAGGAACAACVGNQTCSNGACVSIRPPCGPSTCPAGCCAGGVCMSGTTDSLCGLGGNTCASCSGASVHCVNQQCVVANFCNGVPCANGCCSNGVCVPLASQTNSMCGNWGNTCNNCYSFYAICCAGQCCSYCCGPPGAQFCEVKPCSP